MTTRAIDVPTEMVKQLDSYVEMVKSLPENDVTGDFLFYELDNLFAEQRSFQGRYQHLPGEPHPSNARFILDISSAILSSKFWVVLSALRDLQAFGFDSPEALADWADPYA
jgi:hypothetical protein